MRQRGVTQTLKDEISKKLPEELKNLLSSVKWYIEFLLELRDQLIVHSKDVKHRLISRAGFVSGRRSDILDGLTFLQAYPSKINVNKFNNKPILKLLLPEITSFLSEYLKIIKKENAKTFGLCLKISKIIIKSKFSSKEVLVK